MSNLDNPNPSHSRRLIDCDDKPERPLLTYEQYKEKAGIKKQKDYFRYFNSTK